MVVIYFETKALIVLPPRSAQTWREAMLVHPLMRFRRNSISKLILVGLSDNAVPLGDAVRLRRAHGDVRRWWRWSRSS